MSPNPARLRAAGSAVSKSAGGFDVELPRSLKAERRGEIAILFLARPQKRNAIDDPTVSGIEAFFTLFPASVLRKSRRIAIFLIFLNRKSVV